MVHKPHFVACCFRAGQGGVRYSGTSDHMQAKPQASCNGGCGFLYHYYFMTGVAFKAVHHRAANLSILPFFWHCGSQCDWGTFRLQHLEHLQEAQANATAINGINVLHKHGIPCVLSSSLKMEKLLPCDRGSQTLHSIAVIIIVRDNIMLFSKYFGNPIRCHIRCHILYL